MTQNRNPFKELENKIKDAKPVHRRYSSVIHQTQQTTKSTMQSSASSIGSMRIPRPVQPMSKLLEATKVRFASLSPSELRNRISSRKQQERPQEDTEDQNTTVASLRSKLEKHFLQSINEIRSQSKTVMLPVKLFKDKQSELKTLVNECVKTRKPREVEQINSQLVKLHQEYN